ncbi:hypothetical protein JCM17961_13400 [Endothiovibrio diazotrophicus]
MDAPRRPHDKQHHRARARTQSVQGPRLRRRASRDPVTTQSARDPVTTQSARDPVTTQSARDPVTTQSVVTRKPQNKKRRRRGRCGPLDALAAGDAADYSTPYSTRRSSSRTII